MDDIHKLIMKMFEGNRFEEKVLYTVMDSRTKSFSNNFVNFIGQSDKKPQNIPIGFDLLNS